MDIKIITSMKPKYITPSGTYVYSFHCRLPSQNVIKLSDKFATVEDAYEFGQKHLRYCRDSYGEMGEVCGVFQDTDNSYSPVVNTYYSNT